MSTFVNTPYIPLIDLYPKWPTGFEPHWYVHYYEFDLDASQTLTKLPLQIDTDADFYWRATMGSTDSQFNLLFYSPYGDQLATALDFAENMVANVKPAMFWLETGQERESLSLQPSDRAEAAPYFTRITRGEGRRRRRSPASSARRR